MKTGEFFVFWVLATAAVCAEAALRAINGSVPPPTEAQMEAIGEAFLSLGPAGLWIVAMAILLIVQWVLAGVVILVAAVEVVRWFKRHPPVEIPAEEEAKA